MFPQIKPDPESAGSPPPASRAGPPPPVLLLILLLAAGLRFAGITFDSLWLDEGYQSVVESVGRALPDFTRQPAAAYLFRPGPPGALSEVISRFRQVDPLCPPLYAVLLNRWMTLFGESDLACRALSAVLSLSTLAAVYLVARKVFDRPAATLAVILQAVSPFDIHYAQEARMYSLEILASTLSCGSLIWLAAGGRPASAERLISLAVYAGSTWALINSHYTALFVVLFQGLFLTVLAVKRRDPGLFAGVAAAWLGVLLAWLPWLHLFRQAAAARTASFYVARAASWWWPFWALLVRVPFNWIVFLSGNQVVAYAAPLYATSAFFLAAAARGRRGDTAGDGRPACRWPAAAVFVWAWAIVPPLFVWLLDVKEGHRVVEISRYLVATAPAVYILAGRGASLLIARRRLVILLVAHVFFALLNTAYAHVVPHREPWRQMAALVDGLVAPSELVLVAQPYDIVCLDRYLSRPKLQVGVTPGQGRRGIEQAVGGRAGFWLVTAQEGEAVKDLIPERYRIERQIDLHHGLHLRLYRQR